MEGRQEKILEGVVDEGRVLSVRSRLCIYRTPLAMLKE